MSDSDLLLLPTEADYKQHFIDEYCNKSPILTFDNLPVNFYPDMFEHAFYKRAAKSWKSPKAQVDIERCKRMEWIKRTLLDSSITPLQGYDKARRRYDSSRRVVLVSKDKYVVVIRNVGTTWRFVTAYLIDDDDTYNKLINSPKWVGVTSNIVQSVNVR